MEQTRKKPATIVLKRSAALISGLLLAAVIAGCSTVTKELSSLEDYALIPEGKKTKELATVTVKTDRTGVQQGQLQSPLLPGVTIYGDFLESGETSTFYLTSVRFFTNWPNGWTEGSYEASGIYTYQKQEQKRQSGYLMKAEDPFTLWNIKTGSVRYFDTYFSGEDGLRKVKARVDRIQEVNRFLKDEGKLHDFYRYRNYPKSGPDIETDTFAGILLPLLFPEVKNSFGEECCKETVIGADIRWCTGYSEKLLPEPLVPLRNSGTMWRDWEEANSLWFALYNLEYVLRTLLDETYFIEKRGE